MPGTYKLLSLYKAFYTLFVDFAPYLSGFYVLLLVLLSEFGICWYFATLEKD
jgi:hypothetical protein